MIFLSIVGGLIAFFSFMSGVAIYGVAKSSIHEIYAALLMITAMLGLVMMAVAAAAASIRRAIENSESENTRAARAIITAILTTPGNTATPLPRRGEPPLIGDWKPPG